MTTDTTVWETLHPEQVKAVDFLATWLSDADAPIAVLSGYAGTGKTYSCKAFAEIYRTEVFLFSAPTNKAVQVLQQSLGDDFTVRTTYSLLGLRPNSASESKELVQSLNATQKKLLESISVLVVDEGSMVGALEDTEEGDDWADVWDEGEGVTGELMDFIERASKDFGFKVLYLGDKLQLPPPSSESGVSPVFEQGYPTFNLKDVVRHDGKILDFVSAIRANLVNKSYIFPLPTKYDIPYLRVYTKANLEKDLPAFLDGSLKMIAFRNATVDAFNTLVRQAHYQSKDVAEIQVGDRILFTNPLINIEHINNQKLENPVDNAVGWEADSNFKIIAPIDSQAEIIGIEPVMRYGIPVYEAELRIEGDVNATAYLLGATSYTELDKQIVILRNYAGSATNAKNAIRVMNHYKEFFMPIKFAYAFTSHRAQGSSFERVIVDAGDIMKMRPTSTAMRSAYVGASRAVKELRVLWRM